MAVDLPKYKMTVLLVDPAPNVKVSRCRPSRRETCVRVDNTHKLTGENEQLYLIGTAWTFYQPTA